MCIEIFTLNIQIPLVHDRSDIVELGHKRMLDPVHHAFAPDDQKHGSHQPPRPAWKDHKALWHNPSARAAPPVSAIRKRPNTHFNHVTSTNYEQHEAELEPLDNVGHRHLEEIFFVDAFEDGGLQFNELNREEEGDEGVRVGVNGDVEGNDLVEQNNGVRNYFHVNFHSYGVLRRIYLLLYMIPSSKYPAGVQTLLRPLGRLSRLLSENRHSKIS